MDAPLSTSDRLRLAKAIQHFRREKLSEEQAVAKAHAMLRRGRLDEDGRYVKVPKVYEDD